jgi:hypothetical protein
MSGVVMKDWLADGLKKGGFTEEQINALRIAMSNSGLDPYAESYARGMHSSFEIHGVPGVKHNILYLLDNMRMWKGEEARNCKAILRKIGD